MTKRRFWPVKFGWHRQIRAACIFGRITGYWESTNSGTSISGLPLTSANDFKGVENKTL